MLLDCSEFLCVLWRYGGQAVHFNRAIAHDDDAEAVGGQVEVLAGPECGRTDEFQEQIAALCLIDLDFLYESRVWWESRIGGGSGVRWAARNGSTDSKAAGLLRECKLGVGAGAAERFFPHLVGFEVEGREHHLIVGAAACEGDVLAGTEKLHAWSAAAVEGGELARFTIEGIELHGPAAAFLTPGQKVAAAVDRNGSNSAHLDGSGGGGEDGRVERAGPGNPNEVEGFGRTRLPRQDVCG